MANKSGSQKRDKQVERKNHECSTCKKLFTWSEIKTHKTPCLKEKQKIDAEQARIRREREAREAELREHNASLRRPRN